MATAINYRELYFVIKELTQIEGEPTAEHLIRLNKELKANDTSIFTRGLHHAFGGENISESCTAVLVTHHQELG